MINFWSLKKFLSLSHSPRSLFFLTLSFLCLLSPRSTEFLHFSHYFFQTRAKRTPKTKQKNSRYGWCTHPNHSIFFSLFPDMGGGTLPEWGSAETTLSHKSNIKATLSHWIPSHIEDSLAKQNPSLFWVSTMLLLPNARWSVGRVRSLRQRSRFFLLLRIKNFLFFLRWGIINFC